PADILENGIITDDACDGRAQRLEMMTHQNVGETVVFLRHQYGDLFLRAQVDRNHGVDWQDGSKPRLQPGPGRLSIHFHPDKKSIFRRVDMLTQGNDIEPFLRQHTRDGCNQAYLVLTLNNDDHPYKLVNYRRIRAAGVWR